MYATKMGLLPEKGFQVIFQFKQKGKCFIIRTDCPLANFVCICSEKIKVDSAWIYMYMSIYLNT